jgi:hypothetical protein
MSNDPRAMAPITQIIANLKAVLKVDEHGKSCPVGGKDANAIDDAIEFLERMERRVTPSAPETVPWPERSEYVTPTPYGDGMTMAQIADYESARAEAAMSRLRDAHQTLEVLAAQTSGKPGSTARADCMAAMANAALSRIGELPR